MTKKEARNITGGLSDPSKMPGKGYSLPSLDSCRTGSKLSRKPGTICSNCYGCKNRYRFSNVKKCQNKRINSISNPAWEKAMVNLISREPCRYFRWHDTGDIFSYEYLGKICNIAKELPDYMFFLPTQERSLFIKWARQGNSIPKNITVRVSSVYPGKVPCLHPVLKRHPRIGQSGVGCSGFDCPAVYHEKYECGNCRACWDSSIPVVSYHER